MKLIIYKILVQGNIDLTWQSLYTYLKILHMSLIYSTQFLCLNLIKLHSSKVRHYHRHPYSLPLFCRTKCFPNLSQPSVFCQHTPSCSSECPNFIPPGSLPPLTPLIVSLLPLLTLFAHLLSVLQVHFSLS